MLATIFDKTVEYLTPTVSSLVFQSMDDMQQQQNPPYSRGLFFIQIRQQFLRYEITSKFLYKDIIEPLFTALLKSDQFFCNKDMSKFSMKRIDNTWATYSEMIQNRYPGYLMDEQFNLIECKSDVLISMDELLDLLRSKNLNRYEEVRHHFFGP